jgi:hypothetical protein
MGPSGKALAIFMGQRRLSLEDALATVCFRCLQCKCLCVMFITFVFWFVPWDIQLRTTQDVILYECTPLAFTWIFAKYLPMYSMHAVPRPAVKGVMLGTLSPHVLGWPIHRPRLYLLLTLDATCHLPEGLQAMTMLYRKPVMDCASLLLATSQELHDQRIAASHKNCRAPNSRFTELLSPAKRAYYDIYVKHPRVQQTLASFSFASLSCSIASGNKFVMPM